VAINDNSVIEYESGQNAQPFEAMTDSGDHRLFTASFSPWSGRSGFETTVRPYGLQNGGKITPAASGANNMIDVAALTAFMAAGATAYDTGLVSIAADTDVTVARPTTGTHLISSVTVNDAGNIAVVAGTEGSSFSETRAAAGGPPLIPVDSIEIGQVRYSSQTAAPVKANEIKQVVGLHQERFDFPIWRENPTTGEATFVAALPLIHVGPVTKRVFVRGYTPILAELSRTRDWVPAEIIPSLNTTENYDGPEGSVRRSVNQATFTASLKDGITDAILALKNERLWFRFKQDRNKAAFQLTQGILGISRTYPVSGQPTAAFTVSAEQPTLDFEG
jgi:hypothetical protein